MSEYADDLVGYVEWTPNRHVLVFRRDYGDRSFVRARVFNRHQKHGFFYPSPRSFHVGQACAGQLGEAIVCASHGIEYGEPPPWWAEFEAQYEAGGKNRTAKWKRERAVQEGEEVVSLPPF